MNDNQKKLPYKRQPLFPLALKIGETKMGIL